MRTVRVLLVASAFATFILFLFVVRSYTSGDIFYTRIQGTWVGLECGTVYHFQDRTYTRNGSEPNPFYIRQGIITFSNGDSFHLLVRQSYFIIEGRLFYFRN